MNYLSTEDGLTERYAALAAAIVQQAVQDYCKALEGLYALQCPAEERSKKVQARVNVIYSEYPKEIADYMLKAQLDRLRRWFNGKHYALLTGLDPTALMREAERIAKQWITGEIKRGRQLRRKERQGYVTKSKEWDA